MLKRNGHVFIPLEFESLSAEEQLARAHAFESRMRTRRTVRQFSSRAVPRELIEVALRVASRAPSGANQQPWRFVTVSAPEIKRKIQLAAEAEEKQNYERRFPQEWLDALAVLETDWRKQFLEIAPWLIVVFRIDCFAMNRWTANSSPESWRRTNRLWPSFSFICIFISSASPGGGFMTPADKNTLSAATRAKLGRSSGLVSGRPSTSVIPVR
jgi:hypothetical protein